MNKIKKFSILTGDVNNSGDYLIAHRTKQLFEHFLPEAELNFINRNVKNFSKINEEIINNSDIIIIAGGPAITDNSAENLNITPFLEQGGGHKYCYVWSWYF